MKKAIPWTFILIGIALLVIGIFIGHFTSSGWPTLSQGELRSADGKVYKYISPLLACNDSDSPTQGEVHAIEEEIRAYVELQTKNGTVSDVGVYYRDLSNGPWFGVHQGGDFSPGSLLKVPLLMSLFKEEENHPGFLAQNIAYVDGSSTATQNVPVANPVSAGHDYSIEELAQHMIGASDNNAALLLYQVLGYDKVAESYKELGLGAPSVSEDYIISVRGYATFFRILFNATYLSPQLSERALGLLTESYFKDGLVAGVPSGVVVAHKFGEREFEGESSRASSMTVELYTSPGSPTCSVLWPVVPVCRRLLRSSLIFQASYIRM